MMKQKKILSAAIMLLIATAAYLFGSAFSYNNRAASNLSSYCHIDFQSTVEPQLNKVTAATLKLTDFRYFENSLEAFCTIDIDGKRYRIDTVQTTSTPPTFSLADYHLERFFKYTHTLNVDFPPQVLAEIKTAAMVKISFKYKKNDTAIELPLNQPDLQYWKDQLKLL